VYGEPKPHDRPELWKLLNRIRDKSNDPWFVAGISMRQCTSMNIGLPLKEVRGV
jgi:hypothetical protein